jgi:hypothetical protein
VFNDNEKKLLKQILKSQLIHTSGMRAIFKKGDCEVFKNNEKMIKDMVKKL